MDTDKIKGWLTRRDGEELEIIYSLLKKEYHKRGIDIVKDRGFYKSSTDSEDMKKSLTERFTYDEDSGSGQWF